MITANSRGVINNVKQARAACIRGEADRLEALNPDSHSMTAIKVKWLRLKAELLEEESSPPFLPPAESLCPGETSCELLPESSCISARGNNE